MEIKGCPKKNVYIFKIAIRCIKFELICWFLLLFSQFVYVSKVYNHICHLTSVFLKKIILLSKCLENLTCQAEPFIQLLSKTFVWSLFYENWKKAFFMNIFLYFLVYIDIPYDVINIIHALKQNINCFADPFKSYMKV